MNGRPLLELVVTNSTGNLPAHGKRTKIYADLKNIYTVAQTIYIDTGRWPESIEEMVNPKGPDEKPAICALGPKDPWYNEYKYEIIAGQPRVTCLGNDNAEGGEGEAADITMPEPQAEGTRP